MSITNALRTQLGETEYATFDPRHTERSRYGTYYFHPDFPDRYDANQLFRVQCDRESVDPMLAALAGRAESRRLGFLKLSGYDPDVWRHLGPRLEASGWDLWTSSLLLLSAEPARGANPEVAVRPVHPSSTDLEELYSSDGDLDRGFELARRQFGRLGGEYLVGYVEAKPACCTGWYVANGMARFRHVYTAPWARGRGCATTLILNVQRDPRVQSQDGLAIMVGPTGPAELYQQLGFRFAMDFWEAKLTELSHPERVEV